MALLKLAYYDDGSITYTDIGHGPCDQPVLFWIYADGYMTTREPGNGRRYHGDWEMENDIPSMREVIAHGRYCRRTQRASLAVGLCELDLARGCVEFEFPDVKLILRV